MGYNVSEEKIEYSEQAIEILKSVAATRQPYIMPVSHPREARKLQYQLLELLKCCQVFPRYELVWLYEELSILVAPGFDAVAIAPKGMSFKQVRKTGSVTIPEGPDFDAEAEEFGRELYEQQKKKESGELEEKQDRPKIYDPDEGQRPWDVIPGSTPFDERGEK